MLKPVDYIPLGLAILCYTLAGIFKNTQVVMTAFIGLGGLLTGVALPQLSSRKSRVKKSDVGHAAPTVIFLLLFASAAAVIVLGVSTPRRARADESPKIWSQAWTAGGSAATVNLRNADVTIGDQACTCYSLTYLPLRSGADACLCLRLSTKSLPNAYTVTLGGHHRFAGLAIGLLKMGDEPVVPVLKLTGQAAILGGD